MYFIHSLYSNANIAAKARSCSYVWLAETQKSKLVAKKLQNKPKLSQKKEKSLPIFSCLITIILTKRQTDRQKTKNRGI